MGVSFKCAQCRFGRDDADTMPRRGAKAKKTQPARILARAAALAGTPSAERDSS